MTPTNICISFSFADLMLSQMISGMSQISQNNYSDLKGISGLLIVLNGTINPFSRVHIFFREPVSATDWLGCHSNFTTNERHSVFESHG